MRCIIPQSKLEEFKCSECKRPLSLGPIRVKLDGTSICGRCNYGNDSNLELLARNCAYEAAASLYLFPCIYQESGCPTQIPFNDTSRHESFCSYRTQDCPVQSGCLWSGTIKDILKHYLVEHSELCIIDSASLEFKLTTNFIQPFLLKYRTLHFLLQIKNAITAGKLLFNLIYLENPEKANLIQYTLQLGSNHTKSTITLEQGVALPHTHIQVDLDNSISIDLNGVLAVLEHPDKIECSWTINISKEFEAENEALNRFQCPKCKIYMAPPIYKCKNDHIFCEDCKNIEINCILCKETGIVTSLVRAQALENLANNIDLPCRWAGCHYKTKSIRQHEQECVLRKYKCLFIRCWKWTGSFSSLIEHLRSSHPNHKLHFISDVTCSTWSIDPHDFIIAHGDLFSCHFVVGEKSYAVTIYYRGCPSVASNFRCELEIVDSNGISKLYCLLQCSKSKYKVRIPCLSNDSKNTYKIKITKSSELYINMRLE